MPRELNEQADYLSRIVDYDDWFLNPRFCQHGVPILSIGLPTFSRQTRMFNSRCWNPGTEAMDAFTVDWAGENNWWCPPVALITKVYYY